MQVKRTVPLHPTKRAALVAREPEVRPHGLRPQRVTKYLQYLVAESWMGVRETLAHPRLLKPQMQVNGRRERRPAVVKIAEAIHLKISMTFVASASQIQTRRLEIPARSLRAISNPTMTTTTRKSVEGSDVVEASAKPFTKE